MTPGQAHLTDLLVRAGRGDTTAFAAFYDATAALAYAEARRLVVPSLADRATCRAFVATWRHSASHRREDDPLARLLTVVRREARWEQRRVKRAHDDLVTRRAVVG